MKDEKTKAKYPGIREAMDGNTAVICCERESSDAAGAYPITPSTQMGEYWAEAAAAGHINISDRPLIFIEPEGEHAAAAVTAGLSMTGLRATNFSSGQGIVYMHESLYAAVGKRLTYVLNMGCRAITKATLNVHAGHDDYHAVDDAGFFQLMAKNVQEACDLNIISHRIAELALNPGIVGQDGFLTTHLIESLMLPERELIAEYLGRPDDIIETPTPAQRIIYGDTRRRIPELWTVDNPVMAGIVQNQDSYMQSVAAQRPFFFDHIAALTDQAMDEFYALTGRRYHRVMPYRMDDAEYVIVGQGSLLPNAEAVADYLRETRGLKVGVVNMTMFRPFPGEMLGEMLRGKKGVAVLERTDQPLAEDQPLIREVRAALSRCVENAQSAKGKPYPEYATYNKPGDLPALYSGCYGMGSRDLQPEALIGTIENMLPEGRQQKVFYLSIDFIRDKSYSPKQEVHQQDIVAKYPKVKDLSVRGSENPNLMPKGSITVRFHSVGGWGAITTGKNLAMTLFDLLGYHIKANPKYGSEKKGQPTTYYLSAAPEPIRVNSEYFYVDVVLSPDPNVFAHSNPLAGLKKGGVFIVQSDHETPEAVWASIPRRFQQIIIENEIRFFALDAFKIARDEASDAELQFRMQGIAFQGAFFAASNVMQAANLSDQKLFEAIELQLKHKFGGKGARVVEDNMRVVRRGFLECKEITTKTLSAIEDAPARKEVALPIMLKRTPQSETATTDIHRFWEQTGNFYMSGKGGDNLTDPFIGMSLIPAATGIFRDMTAIRFYHPEWLADKCTACGSCWTVCPDSAIPGLVNSISDVFETAIKRLENAGEKPKFLRRAVVTLERKLREMIDQHNGKCAVTGDTIGSAIKMVLADSNVAESERADLEKELGLFHQQLKDFSFAATTPYWGLREKEEKGSGALLSITLDPYTCKGCMECVRVCEDGALQPILQTTETVATLRKNWELWLDLPTTKPEYMRIDSLEEGIGALETLLLDKAAYKSIVGGDGACVGCGEKTAIHLFTAAATALMAPRVKKHLLELDDLIARLERHIRLKLAESMDVSDTSAVSAAVTALKDKDLTLANLSAALDAHKGTTPIDSEWLKRVTQVLAKLKHLKWQYTHGATGNGRSAMGMINSTGCTSVWASTYPFNPYPFPWTNHLFQDSTSVAMGIFEGHMAKMAEGFKAIRTAELEIAGKYNPAKHEEYFRYFDWRKFTDEEFLLCPPVVAVGGDGSMYDIGFQNLSRMMMSGKPIKVIIVDTQVYSNTGGQACTSGFIGQVSDMAQFGKAQKGKEEVRKEIGLIGMAHRTSYILQGSVANTTQLLEGYIQGLMSRRPALFNVYCPCMPEHGIADDLARHQARIALESRAYPIFRYDPDRGKVPSECFDLEGNPSVDSDWPTYTLNYTTEDGKPESMTLPLTFADFAVTEGRFRKHFKKAPRDTWNEDMVHVAEFIELSPEDREGKFPYILAVDRNNRLSRVIVSQTIVQSCEERKDFWVMLRSLAGVTKTVDVDAIVTQTRAEVMQRLTAGLLELASGGDASLAKLANLASAPVGVSAAPQAASAGGNGSAPAGAGEGYVPPTLDSSLCSACGECIQVNPAIFAYNDKKQAFITNPKGGPYKDLVKAAEKCVAAAIRPGMPSDRSEKGVDKLIKRAEKFNK